MTPGQPQRTIPTVIAGTPARYARTPPPDRPRTTAERSFAAVLPDAGQRTGASAGTGIGSQSSRREDHGLLPHAPGNDDGIRCPECRQPVPAGRRFCRCGATVVRPVAPDEDEDADIGLPWHRSLRDRLGSGSAFWRAVREANDGARAKFDRAQSWRNRGLQLLAGLGIVGLGASQLGPWGGDLRETAWERASGYLPLPYTPLLGGSAEAVPVAEPLPGLEPANAVDRDTGRAWATAWSAPGSGGSPCERPAGASRLVITFPEPVDVDRLALHAGLSESSFDRPQQSRPKVVDVLLSDGTGERTCSEVALDDTAARQVFPLSGRQVTTVTLSVVDVYPGESTAPAGGLVAFSEVELERR